MTTGDIYKKDHATVVLTWWCDENRIAAIRFEDGNASDDSFTQEELEGWVKTGSV